MDNGTAVKRQKSIPYGFILSLVVMISFGKLFTSDFTWWDDPHTVHQNPYLNPAGWDSLKYYWSNQAANIYIPLTYTVWIFLSFIARVESGELAISLNPWIYHTANILFHVATAILVYKLLNRLVKDNRAAFFGALLYAIHPEQVESVGWISGLKDVMAGCFTMAVLWQYAMFAENSSKKHYILSIFFFILATLSKPSAITTPALILIIDAFITQQHSQTIWNRRYLIRLIQRLIPFAMIALPIAMLARSIQHGMVQISPAWSRPLVMMDSISFYLAKLFLPLHVNLDYSRNPIHIIRTGEIYYTWIFSLAVLLFCIGLFRKGVIYPMAGILIFIFAPFHVLGLTTFDYQTYSTVADHYQYVALLGPALCAAFVFRNWNWKSKLIVLVYVPFFAVTTFFRCGAWKDDQTLLVTTYQINPKSLVAIPNLAAFCIRTMRYDDAQFFSQLGSELDPNNPIVLVNRGMVELNLRQYDRAAATFERLIEAYQQFYGTESKANIEVYTEIANKYLEVNLYTEAQSFHDRAAQVEPGSIRLANLQKRIDACKAQVTGKRSS